MTVLLDILPFQYTRMRISVDDLILFRLYLGFKAALTLQQNRMTVKFQKSYEPIVHNNDTICDATTQHGFSDRTHNRLK